MQPEAIDSSSTSSNPDEFQSKIGLLKRRVPEEEDTKTKEDEGFLILDAPKEQSVVDVYLGEEKKLVQLPSKLARGLAVLLLNAPERSTLHIPAEDEVWQTMFLSGWWDEIVRVENVSSNRQQPYYVTESLSLPQISVNRFNAFKEWAKQKRQELTKIAEAQPGASRKRLHLDLWTVLGDQSYEKNVRASSESADTESDADEDIGESHGGGVPLDNGPLYYPGDEKPKVRENWQLVDRPKGQ